MHAPRKPGILLLLVLASSGMRAQQQATANRDFPVQSALKGCLSATLLGGYKLTDDETGTVYNLVANPENLRMLVGNDVLVTGHSLRAFGDGTDEREQNNKSAREPGAREASDTNSFQVVNALKVADVCSLSAAQASASLLHPDR